MSGYSFIHNFSIMKNQTISILVSVLIGLLAGYGLFSFHSIITSLDPVMQGEVTSAEVLEENAAQESAEVQEVKVDKPKRAQDQDDMQELSATQEEDGVKNAQPIYTGEIIHRPEPYVFQVKEGAGERIDMSKMQTQTFRDLFSMDFPMECKFSPDDGSVDVYCPTEDFPHPLPEMTIWFDDNTVTIYRYEGLASNVYDYALLSLRLKEKRGSDVVMKIDQ
jgi:hypothetical protein